MKNAGSSGLFDATHTPTAAELAELERQRIEAAKTFAQWQAERQAAEAERLRLEAEAWQHTLEAEHEAQREYELCHPELARQGTDRMLTENFTPIVKVDENGRPLMLVRRTGPDGQEVDVWATPKDQELADNFVQNSAGEWELRGEQERHRKFADERFVSDYLVPSMQKAQDSTMAFVEVNLTMASIVAGGAGVSGFAPKLIGMGKEALSEFTGLPVGFKDIKDLFSRKALGQVDEVAGNNAGKVVTTGETGAFGARELGLAISKDDFATLAYGRIQKAGFDVHLVSQGGNIAGETLNIGIVNLNLMRNGSLREAMGTMVHESAHVDMLMRTGRVYGARGVGEYMARAREFLYLNGRRPNAGERTDLIKLIRELGYEHR